MFAVTQLDAQNDEWLERIATLKNTQHLNEVITQESSQSDIIIITFISSSSSSSSSIYLLITRQ